MSNCRNRDHAIPSHFTRYSIHYTIHNFIRLLYQPFDFFTDINGWNQIKDLAMTWGFVDVMLMAMQQIQTVNSRNRSTIRRLPLRTTVLQEYWHDEIIKDNSA